MMLGTKGHMQLHLYILEQVSPEKQISGYQGKGGCLLNEYRVSFWSNSGPLEHDRGDVCSVGMY